MKINKKIKENIICMIQLIHILLILFIILAPFYNEEFLIKAIFLVSIVYYKWKINGSCFFTKLEYLVMGNNDEEEGFIYRIINPILNLNEIKFDYNLEYLTLAWFFILILIYVIRFY